MKIIKTKYLSPTNHRGARIKASAGHFTATLAWDYSLDSLPNHVAAVKNLLLVNDLEWDIHDMGYGYDETKYYFTLGRVSA